MHHHHHRYSGITRTRAPKFQWDAPDERDSSAYDGLDIPRVRLETIVIVLSEYTRIYAARLKTSTS